MKKELVQEIIKTVKGVNSQEVTVPFTVNVDGVDYNNLFTVISTQTSCCCCYRKTTGDGIVIFMSRDIFDRFSDEAIGFLISHEIGHTKDRLKFDKKGKPISPDRYPWYMSNQTVTSMLAFVNEIKRGYKANAGKVELKEIAADAFAAKYFNFNSALSELKQHFECCGAALAVKEIENRIAILKEATS